MPCYGYQGVVPVVDATSYIHPLASLIGDVFVGPGCFIGPGASLRGDFGRIIVEGDSSLQDNATVHANQPRDTIIRRGATIAHGAVIHGCEIGENTLVGMNAVILDDAIIGPENLIGALALVKSDLQTPARSLVIGNPGKVVKTFAPHEVTWRNDGNGEYQRLARAALTDLIRTEPLRHADDKRQASRMKSDAIAIRLSGETASIRQQRSSMQIE
jgi:carbonic anhydrase/acetyltransferase-like protein (isoleucine patch superfamily)